MFKCMFPFVCESALFQQDVWVPTALPTTITLCYSSPLMLEMLMINKKEDIRLDYVDAVIRLLHR